MYNNQQRNQRPYTGSNGEWWKIALFGWLGFLTGFSLFWIMAVFFGIKLVMDIKLRNSWQNVPSPSQGPLERRRNEQMRKYDQESSIPSRRPSPQAQVKANPYKTSGIKKYKDFDLEEAIEDFKKGLAISPNDIALHFNIACAYSLIENKSLAYHHIATAVTSGLTDIEKIEKHDDLAYVRIQPEFDGFRKGGYRTNPFPTKGPEKSLSESAKEDTNIDASLLSQLTRLADMRQQGNLSDDEFMIERKKLLRQ